MISWWREERTESSLGCQVTIDEIKCIYMDVSRLEEPIRSTWHRLCAMAGFYSAE